MLLEEMRQKVVDYGNQLISSGLTIGTAGNISMYDPEILWTANAHLPVNTVYMLPFI